MNKSNLPANTATRFYLHNMVKEGDRVLFDAHYGTGKWLGDGSNEEAHRLLSVFTYFLEGEYNFSQVIGTQDGLTVLVA